MLGHKRFLATKEGQFVKEEFFKRPGDSIYVPPQGPGAAAPPSQELYARMGEANIRALLHDFYIKLGTSALRGMFPSNLALASERSALFFIGLMGGPPLYAETYGPPRMRARHLPFRITEAHRLVWLACFYVVLEASERYQFPPEHLPGFKAFLESFSQWMVNTAE